MPRRVRCKHGLERDPEPTTPFFPSQGSRPRAATPIPGRGLRYAQDLTRGIVGVTLGQDGFLWLEGGVERHLTAPTVSAVDTLAAGDIFHGAFALCIGERSSVADAARFANAAAAIKCTRPGGRLGAPSRAEVEAFLSERA